MTFQKIQEVANMHVQHLQNLGVLIRMMGDNEPFSQDPVVARNQMLGHAHYLLAHSIPKLFIESELITDPVSLSEHHCNISQYFGSAQTLLWASGFCDLGKIKSINRTE